MTPKVNILKAAMYKSFMCSKDQHLIIQINIESGPPEFGPGYLILEPVAGWATWTEFLAHTLITVHVLLLQANNAQGRRLQLSSNLPQQVSIYIYL